MRVRPNDNATGYEFMRTVLGVFQNITVPPREIYDKASHIKYSSLLLKELL